MIPILYKETETEFLNNGVGLLKEAISCEVTEVRNGAFECELQYPKDGRYFEDLKEGAYIMAKPSDADEPQPFRIYKVSQPIAGVATYKAEHMSYELNACPVPNFSAADTTPQDAIDRMITAAAVAKPYEAWSNIATIKSMSIKGVYNLRKLLGGVEGSVLDTWGGEYQFDRYTVKLHAQRGADNGVVIRYGKNLVDARMEKNIQSVTTAIFPYAWYTKAGTDQEVFVSLPEKTIATPNAGKYARVYCQPVDLSQEFEAGVVITETMLRAKAVEYARSGIDEPKISIKVSFIDLSKTRDYANADALERVGLCDTVTVILDRLGLVEKAKVVKTVYDSIHERCISFELGEARANLAQTIALKQKEQEAATIEVKSQMERRIAQVTAAITGNSGGYVLLSPAENPKEIFIMDTPDTATARNVWRWNLEGLGHSSTGIGGPFTTALTAAGVFVADFIQAGTMAADRLKGGTLTLGGAGNGNGVLRVYDAYNNEICTISKDGVTIKKGDFTLGGSGNKNGTMTVLDASGNAICTINKDGVAITKGTISQTITKSGYTTEFQIKDGEITGSYGGEGKNFIDFTNRVGGVSTLAIGGEKGVRLAAPKIWVSDDWDSPVAYKGYTGSVMVSATASKNVVNGIIID